MQVSLSGTFSGGYSRLVYRHTDTGPGLQVSLSGTFSGGYNRLVYRHTDRGPGLQVSLGGTFSGGYNKQASLQAYRHRHRHRIASFIHSAKHSVAGPSLARSRSKRQPQISLKSHH